MDLSQFNRVKLGHLPTPFERLGKLTEYLDGPEIYIKRDDCTGLVTGGNKTRKLEYLVADAIDQGADTLVTQGATQSNHVRQTAAAARLFGLSCYALLERRVTNMGASYERNANVFLDDLLGCHTAFRDDGADMNREAVALAEDLRRRGLKPYVIPGGGSNPVGALGYAQCVAELAQQASECSVNIDRIVLATGSTGTQAGLVAGVHALDLPILVEGVSVRLKKAPQVQKVHDLACRTSALIGTSTELQQTLVRVHDQYVGPGYGQPTPEMVDAVRLLAKEEAILLDPVYSGKGMAGLIGLVRNGTFKKGETIVFLHTGGAVALFAYQHLFEQHRATQSA